MAFDVLVLDSGEWELSDELLATPWHILLYRLRHSAGNALHIWLPRGSEPGAKGYVFRRYWQEGEVRWCVEIPPDPDGTRVRREGRTAVLRIRFTCADGRVLWAETPPGPRLGDFTEEELRKLLGSAVAGPYTRI